MLESFYLKDNPDRVEAQWRQKTAIAAEILGRPALRMLRPEILGDRTRIDLMWSQGKLGIRIPTRDGQGTTLQEVRHPDTVTSTLDAMIEDLRRDPLPVELAQLRLREGVDGLRGIWIDTANESIRDLLEERQWLSRALYRGWIIEVGQKRKEVSAGSDSEKRPELVRATGRCWLPSYDVNNDEIRLKSYASLFSQPGPETNRSLIAAGFDLLDSEGIDRCRWAEWGAGYGNLTAAFISRLGVEGSASELDAPAAELLVENIHALAPGFRCDQRIAEAGASDFEQQADLWVIDPPRPGFGVLLETLKGLTHPPRWVLAYHCHAKGLIADTRILRESNFKLSDWSTVDAFPATAHHEVVSLWKRSQ